eukprot:CAMPEP_0118929760 /NCGR_PEP_ID=MMETSP1169-20130426/6665_1 /TAXON_ID=36882 /ORGANISM="Pyramimonas obovata, Strain CCMP722" /LENGTH=238 /DNA_ID=CAMNT_0006872009 /DNA_START=72 /DNA_END=788 /DNA_ORIENTATION=-
MATSSVSNVRSLGARSRVASSVSVRAPARRSVVARGSKLAVWNKIDYVAPSKVAKLVEEGYAVLDVRTNIQFDRSHLKNTTHIPLFKEDDATDPQSLLNQQLHRGAVGSQFGTAHTVRNDRFEELVSAKFAKDDKVLVCCQQGLRSNTAAQDLAKAGFTDLACIEGGFNTLKDDLLGSLETEGPEPISKAGLGGLVKYQKTISFTIGGILFAAYAFIQLFPEQGTTLLAATFGPNVVP